MNDKPLSICLKIRFPSPANSMRSMVSERNRSNFDSYNPSYVRTISDAVSLNNDVLSIHNSFQEENRERANSIRSNRETIRSPLISTPIRFPRSPKNPPRHNFTQRLSLFAKNNKANIRSSTSFEILKKSVFKIFKGEELEMGDLGFGFHEFNVFRGFVGKKFKNCEIDKADEDNYNTEFKEKVIGEINPLLNQNKSTKRIEENNKFVFKTALDHIKNNFFQSENLKNNKYGELRFYKKYFSGISESKNININNFFYPLYRPSLKNRAFKSINSRYLDLVFESGEFLKEFKTFMENDLKADHINSIKERVDEILGSLEEEKDVGKFEKFVEDFERKKRLKLPWSIVEAENAIEQFKSILSKY